MASAEGYDASTYGDRMADFYDELPTHPADADAAARCLADLTDGGRALELGIGTDASAAMVAKLQAKPGGAEIPVEIGDFADVGVDGRFSLIFVVYNTFFSLLDRDTQRGCFERVAERLAPAGRFVIEAFVPDPACFERGQHLEVRHVGVDSAVVSVSRHDAPTQRVDSLLVRLADGGVRTWPVHIRYSYPGELDQMADRAGLRLEERWGGWEREPFTDDSVKHVSVYAVASARSL